MDPRVPVLLDGHEVLRVGGVTALPASRRAGEIGRRLEVLVEGPDFDPQMLALAESPIGLRVMAGDRVVMHVTEADAQLEGVSKQVLAGVNRAAFVRAVERARQERTPEALQANAREAGLASLLLLLLLFFEVRLSRWLDGWMARWGSRKMDRLQMDRFRRETAEKLLDALRSLLHGLWVIVGFVALVLWLQWVLSRFYTTREMAVRARYWLEPWFHAFGDALLATIPKLLVLVLIGWGTVVVLRWMTIFFRGLGAQTIRISGFEPEWAVPTMKLARVGLVAFAIVLAYPFIPGSETSAFKGVSIFAGVVFSLSSTTAVTNVIAGYMLAYRRPFRVGDVVRLNEIVGEMMEIRVLVTRLKTIKNEEVTVPNALILNGEVTNYSALSRQNGLVLQVPVSIGYDVPWRQVEAMLLQAAKETPGLLEEPAPYVLQRELGASAVRYELNIYATDPKQMDALLGRLHRNVQDVFSQHGVQIMTPNYVVDPAQPKLVPPERWHQAPAPPPPEPAAPQTPGST